MEENTIEVAEKISLEDPFQIDIDPFQYDEKDLEIPEDVFGEVEEEEEEEEQKEDVEEKNNSKKQKEEEQEGDKNKEEEKDRPDSSGITPELELAAAIGSLQFLARKKGIEDKIDYTKIESLEEVEDLLDDLEEFDQVVAIEGLKQSNETIAKIVDFIDKKGNPEDILEYLTTSKEIAAIDISKENGAKELVKQYYKKVVKYSDEIINKKIQKLEDNDMLLSEAEDLSPLYQEHINKELEDKTKKLEETNRIKQIEADQKKAEFVNILKQNQVGREVAGELFNTAFATIALKTGEQKPLIDYKIEQMKADSQKYLKLVNFINNPEHYDAQVLANKGSEIVKKTTTQRLQIVNNIKNKSEAPTSKERSNKLTFNFNK